MKHKQTITLSAREHGQLELAMKRLIDSKKINLDSGIAILKKLQDADKVRLFRSPKPWDN